LYTLLAIIIQGCQERNRSFLKSQKAQIGIVVGAKAEPVHIIGRSLSQASHGLIAIKLAQILRRATLVTHSIILIIQTKKENIFIGIYLFSGKRGKKEYRVNFK